MSQSPVKKLEFSSKLSEVHRAMDTILEEVRGHDYGSEAFFAIRLALDEALTNAVRHGNCGDAGKNVVVEYSVDDEVFRAVVTDEGCGFEPNKVPDPTSEENIDRPSGRGVMLMKAYMTEVSYNAKGNRVTLVKHRHCRMPNSVAKP